MPSLSSSAPKHQGPPLLLVAGSYVVLALCGVFSGKLLAPNVPFAMPYDSVAKAVAHVQASADATRWGSFFQLASAMPLLVFIATAVNRLRFLGIRAAGATIALCGGIVATGMLAFSALSDWALSTPEMATLPGAVRVLQLLGFMGGGPGFVMPLGLFYLGISITAGLYRFIPKWLMWTGIVLGVCSEVASLTLVTWKAAPFIPVGRYLGILWMIAIALTLPNRRPEPSNT
jgi:hypothetical protein